ILEGLSGGGDEGRKIGGRDVAVLDGLVTDDDELDEVPLAPADELLNVRLTTGDTGAVDVDTHDHLKAVLFGRGSDVLKTAAVSAVDTDGTDALGSNLGDVCLNLVGRHALAIVSVGREGHTVGLGTVTVATAASGAGAGGASSRARRGLSGRGSSQLRSGSGRGSRGSRDSRGSSGGGSRQDRGGRGRADIHGAGVSHGEDSRRLVVGTRGDGRGRGVDDRGAGGNRGGEATNGVGAGGRADVSRVRDPAGDHGARGAGLSDGACHGSRGLDDSGDTTVGVLARSKRGGGGITDGLSAGGAEASVVAPTEATLVEAEELEAGAGELVEAAGELEAGAGELVEAAGALVTAAWELELGAEETGVR
ncbi:hypothetical protein KEM55_007737, partial [Ascosphaera atra]